MRTSSRHLHALAVADLAAVLVEVGYDAHVDVELDGRRHDLMLAPSDGGMVLEVKARAVASTLPDRWLVAEAAGAQLVVVADVVTDTARGQLDDAGSGWFDRRGNLCIPGLFEGGVSPRPRQAASSATSPVAGRAALEVAVVILAARWPGVRELARLTAMAPSSISSARSELREQLLVTSDDAPVLPDLFDEVSAAWRPQWTPVTTEMAVEVDLVHGGDLGAVLNGAPLVVGSATAPRWYAEDARQAAEAVREMGRAERAVDAVAWVAQSPARMAWMLAEERHHLGAPWASGRTVPAVVSAVELARDPSRGREILAAWGRDEDVPWGR